MLNKSQEELQIAKINISSTSENEVIRKVSSSIKNSKKLTITTPNPEIIVMAQRDKELRDALNASDIAIPDGVGIQYAKKVYGISSNLARIRGREMMVKLLDKAGSKQWKVFLLGATKAVNARAVKKMKSKYVNVKVKGMAGPVLTKNLVKVTTKDMDEEKKVMVAINRFKPDIVFVALGAPKQEKWIYRNKDKLSAKVLMVVGGALDTYVGKVKPPPQWMADVGLEWLWRLVKEPTRLFRIYNATIGFIYIVLKDRYFSS